MTEQNTYTDITPLAQRVIERLNQLRMNKAELAMKYGYSRPAVSQYLNGKYKSDPSALEGMMQQFLDDSEMDVSNKGHAGDKVLKPKVQFFESRDFISTIGICQSCQENQGLGIVVGKSGYGKTHALKHYAKLPRVAYIECDDTMACRDLVEAIESGLGMPKIFGGTIWNRVNRIREFFNINTGYLLIIDEADKLISKYTQKKMEILRGIFDQSNVGMVIAGEPRLEADIKGSLTRFANRTDFYYKLRGLSKDEVRRYFDAYDVEEAAMDELTARACNTQHGCFRLLDRTLNNVIRILKDTGETRITMKVINEASRMMML